MSGEDIRVVVCNFADGTKIFSTGAKAYVMQLNPGNGDDRIVILGQSRSGRMVQKWERRDRLKNFRLVTLPPANPLYGRVPSARDIGWRT